MQPKLRDNQLKAPGPDILSYLLSPRSPRLLGSFCEGMICVDMDCEQRALCLRGS